MNKKILSITETALMSAVIAVCAFVTVPSAVPFTLQTFGIFLALRILGAAKGTVSVIIYIAAGAAGLPVFSGFRGGVSVIAGPTGGYILGFIPLCLVYLAAQKLTKGKKAEVCALATGLFVCYAFGTLWFAAVSGQKGIIHILSLCVFPFIIPDAVKLALAVIAGDRIKKLKNRNKS